MMGDVPADATSPILIDDDATFSNESRVRALEEELAQLGSELALARAELEGNGSNGLADEVKRRAHAAYESVNDALSQLRSNILLAKKLVGELGGDSETARSLSAAIAASIDSAEDAKGVLRGLREVAEA